MAGTRSSNRLANTNSSPSTSQNGSPSGERKRKAESNTSTPSKRGKKQQKTLDETMPEAIDAPDDDDMKEAAVAAEEANANGKTSASVGDNDNNEKATNGHADTEHAGKKEDKVSEEQEDAKVNGEAAEKSEDTKDTSSKSNAKVDPNDGAVEESKERRDAMPSNILEKGIIYFFTRGRVNIDEPKSVQDIARSYIVLRPLPHGAKLTDGPIEDLKDNRLIALPKKVLPASGKDRFMLFVEKAGVTIEDLKKEFMEGSEYSTQTTGDRHTPPVTPIGEGVYAICSQGNQSHLAYMLTIPSDIGDVQKSMGLMPQGSFVLSAKNPDQEGPANASLPQGPDFPKDIMEEFRGRRWMPLQPKHLDYPNAQFLFIGEGSGDMGKAVEGTQEDKENDDKNTAEEEIEKLEGEDEQRVKGLEGSDAVFHDLGISKKDYPQLKTTW